MAPSFYQADKQTHRRVMVVGLLLCAAFVGDQLFAALAAARYPRARESRPAGQNGRRGAPGQLARVRRICRPIVNQITGLSGARGEACSIKHVFPGTALAFFMKNGLYSIHTQMLDGVKGRDSGNYH